MTGLKDLIGEIAATVIESASNSGHHRSTEVLAVLTPDMSRRDIENATTSEALARGRRLAERVEDLDWDEYSIWGALPGEGIGELLLHHTRPVSRECPCRDARGGELCAHMVALGLACIGNDTTLADRLATIPHHDLVALVIDLADRSAWAREAIWSRVAQR